VTDTIRAGEGLVAWLGGVRVGVANIWERPYELEEGSAATGLSAQLMPDDGEDAVVGEGSHVEFGGTQFRVVEVVKHGDERGYVVFQPFS
jgi:hypothetical protein